MSIHGQLEYYLRNESKENSLYAVNAVFMSDKIIKERRVAYNARLAQYDTDMRKLFSKVPEEHKIAHGGFYQYEVEIERYLDHYMECPDCFALLWDDILMLEDVKDNDLAKIYFDYSEMARKEGNRYLESSGIEYEEIEVTFVKDDGSVDSVENYTVMYLTKEQIENFPHSENLIIELELFPGEYKDEDKDGKVTLNHRSMVAVFEPE